MKRGRSRVAPTRPRWLGQGLEGSAENLVRVQIEPGLTIPERQACLARPARAGDQDEPFVVGQRGRVHGEGVAQVIDQEKSHPLPQRGERVPEREVGDRSVDARAYAEAIRLGGRDPDPLGRLAAAGSLETVEPRRERVRISDGDLARSEANEPALQPRAVATDVESALRFILAHFLHVSRVHLTQKCFS